MSVTNAAREATGRAWTWMKSDKGLMLWAVLVGIASGLLAVVMKQSVGGLRSVMFAIQGWIGGSWLLALGPMLGLAATAYVVQTVLKGDHPGPGIPATLHAISTRRGRMKRTWMFAPVITSVLSVGFGGSGGLEAPAVQAGAAMGSEVASQTRRHFRRRLLLIGCAAAGSLAGHVQSPRGGDRLRRRGHHDRPDGFVPRTHLAGVLGLLAHGLCVLRRGRHPDRPDAGRIPSFALAVVHPDRRRHRRGVRGVFQAVHAEPASDQSIQKTPNEDGLGRCTHRRGGRPVASAVRGRLRGHQPTLSSGIRMG